MTAKEKQLKYFEWDKEIAAEYSVVKSCLKSDSGYHCNHYDEGKECCLCEEKAQY